MLIENRYRLIAFGVLTALACALFASLVAVAADNHFMVRAFDTDESGKLFELFKLYGNGSWKPLTYHYGTAHTNVSLFLGHLLSLFKTVEYTDMAIIGRGVNLLALVATAAVFMAYGRSRENTKWFFLFVCCLYFLGINFKFSLNAKPEHLQGLFVVCSVFSLKAYFTRQKFLSLFFSGLFAGLAFATKYAGGLLLAFESLCLLWFWFKQGEFKASLVKLGRDYVVLAIGAFIALALFNPYMLIDYQTIIATLKLHTKILGTGFLSTAEKSWLDWFRPLFGREMLWWGIAVWLLPAFIRQFGQLKKSWREFPESSVDLLWVLFYFCYLFATVNEITARFMLVVLPFLLDLIFAELAAIEGWLKSQGRRHLSAATFALVFACVVYSAGSSKVVASEIWGRSETDRIEAGLWLSENVSHSELIAYDFYTYVPPEFVRRFHQPYLTAYEVMTVRPDYIVSSKAIMSRYLDIEKAQQYSRGKDMYLKHYYLYSKLSEDVFPGYSQLMDFGGVRIFRKNR